MGDTPDAEVDDREILAAFANTDERYVRPADAAESLPASSDALRDRFEELAGRGLLVRDEEREPATAWRLADDAAEALDVPADEVVTDVEAQAERVVESASSPHDLETVESQPPEPGAGVPGRPYEAPDDAIEAFDPPGNPDQTEQRRRALRRAAAFVRQRGEATRAELVDEVFPEEPGAYEDPDDGWWEEVVRPGLDRLPDVEPTADGETWRFTRSGTDEPSDTDDRTSSDERVSSDDRTDADRP